MMSSRERTPLWLFFVTVYLFSWAYWIPLALSQQANVGVLLLGGSMPSLLGIAFTYLTQGRTVRRDFWSRVYSVRRIAVGWLAFILLLFPALYAPVGLLYTLAGGSGLSLARAQQLVTHPAQLLVFVLILLVGGPLAEELGWQGFALDRLHARWNALLSSLILGGLWAMWHLPLFFIPGTFQHALGFGTATFWLFLISIVSLAVIITWVYHHTQRSILAAILLHFMFNTTGALVTAPGQMVLPAQLLLYGTIPQVLVALIVAIGEARTPARSIDLTKGTASG